MFNLIHQYGFKKITNSVLIFIIKRRLEIIGLIIVIIGLLLLVALVSYSPSDPNFIFPENTKIKNILGFQGSYTSDLFFQSIGLISYLVPFTLFFTGVSVFVKKKFLIIIENIFYIVPYSIVGSLFFDFFYKNSFSLYINGNGGFVGNYLNKTFLSNLITSYEVVSYYGLASLIILLFLLSINFNLKYFYSFLKKISKKDNKNYTNKNEIISEYIPQDEIKNLIQEDLPFIKSDKPNFLKDSKFKLPSLDLLKTPTKNERENSNKNENNDPEFLEKILLDFGVSGNIKSHGPVVTLSSSLLQE